MKLHFLHKMLGFHPMNDEAGAGGGAPAAAATPAAAAAPAADAGAAAQGSDTLLGGKATPDAGGAAADEGGARDGDQATDDVVPETYEPFTLAEGFEMDEEVGAEFASLAKELGLTQKNAQRLIDLQNKLEGGKEEARREYLEGLLTEQRTRWANDLKNDPDFGGENYQQNVSTAIKAMQAFGDDEVRTLLNESGIGNNPAVVKMFHKIGLAITEDRFVMPGSTTKTADAKRAADVMFPGVN